MKARNPNKWHRKPKGSSDKACAICGYPAKCRGEHRATAEGEGYDRKYLRRDKTPAGLKFVQLGGLWHRQRRTARSLTDRHAERIFKATTLLAQGVSHEETARRLEVSKGTLSTWQWWHRQFWNESFDAALAKVVDIVRTEAGTDAVFRDVDEYLRMAERADKWAVEKDEPLFPVGDDPTVSSFFANYFLPVCQADVHGHNLFHYKHTVKLWRLLSGDPPLKDITNAMLAKYRDALAKRRGLKPHLRYSPFTVANKLRHLQSILDKAGPPARRNRDAAGILDRVPYVKPPKTILPPRQIVPLERVRDTCAAAVCATVPDIPGFKPAAWWRAILVTAMYTGLRRRTLLSLRMTDIDWQARVITIPGERMKSGRPLAVPMHQEVVDHLTAIRTDRELVFPFPSGERYFHETLRKIQAAAGIREEEFFGLHALRRTLATMLYEVNPAAAMLALGHTALAVTTTHYVRPDDIVARAIHGLPTLETV